MSMSKWILAGAAAIGFAGSAYAQDFSDCVCVTPVVPGPGIGTVINADGDVMMSTPGGFSTPADGEIIPGSTHFILGCNASASISLGQNCQGSLKPGTETEIIVAGGNICIKPGEQTETCGAGLGNGNGMIGLPEEIFLGVTGLGTVFAVTSGDNPFSK